MPDTFDLVLRAENAATPEGIRPVEIGVSGGTITQIQPLGTGGLQAPQIVEVPEDQVLLPGLVDTHVHVNEPGRTEWEGFESATRAAAAGGVTTIVDMPLNSIPATVTTEALEQKQRAAAGKLFVDTGFWGGAVPGNTADLGPLHEAGVYGFKCFLEHSGVEEFPHLEIEEMIQDMAEISGFDGLMIVHAEDAETLHQTRERTTVSSSSTYADFLASRPKEAERVAVLAVIAAAESTGARAHILHLSNADVIKDIAAARDRGVRITVETCPHYLTLLSEEIADGLTAYKCCPPIREESNRARLWEGLEQGVIDIIVSDHSPSTVELKEVGTGDFITAWGGISSLQLGLSLIWTEARRRGIGLEKVVEWMATRPAQIAQVTNKGALVMGHDADFAIFDPEESWTVSANELHHRNPITAYEGKTLTGRVTSTWLRGSPIDLQHPTGGFLRRSGGAQA